MELIKSVKTSSQSILLVVTDHEGDDGVVIRVYYNTDNDRLYHGNELQYFEIDGEVKTLSSN